MTIYSSEPHAQAVVILAPLRFLSLAGFPDARLSLYLLARAEGNVVEPFSAIIVGTLTWLFGHIASNARKEANDELRKKHSKYSASLLALEAQEKTTIQSLNGVVSKRGSYFRHLLKRIQRSAKRVGPRYKPFDRATGWFNGQSETDISNLSAATNSVFAKLPPITDDEVNLAIAAVWFLDGIHIAETADKFHFPDIPMFHESIHDFLGHLPLDGLGLPQVADAVGLGGLEVGDVLGPALTIFSVGRSFYNFYKAGETQANAEKLDELLRAVEEKRAQLTGIGDRATNVTQALEQSAYEAFKWSWVVGKTPVGAFSRKKTRATTYATNLEMAVKRFWAVMAIPMRTEDGQLITNSNLPLLLPASNS